MQLDMCILIDRTNLNFLGAWICLLLFLETQA